ncbi:hypothetical protein ScPMuIL_002857 [Solemya velum]
MAEARSAVADPRVTILKDIFSHNLDFIYAWRRNVIRRFFRTRNLIGNGMWPTSIWNLVILVTALGAMMLSDWPVSRPLTSLLWRFGVLLHLPVPEGSMKLFTVMVTSWVFGLVVFILLLYFRRYTLRLLLSYHGWLYENLRTQSKSTVLWSVLVRMLSGYNPTIYSCQQSLPRLPVPPLNDTLRKLVESLEPLYLDQPEKLDRLKEDVETFRTNLGPTLQRLLVFKSWWSPNYITDWWEKYVYLKGRSPLPVNSNYYILDQSYYIPTHRQVSRAASVIYQTLLMKQRCDHEELQALRIRDTIPLCMAQYEKIYSSTRIPGDDIDEFKHYDASVSKHIVVVRRGIMYKLDMYDSHDKLLSAPILETTLQWIVDDAELHKDTLSEEERSLPALTGLERNVWAQTRRDFLSTGVNSESLHTLESSILVANLLSESCSDMSSSAKSLLHGDGRSIWFDKSFNLLFYANGRCGFNCEHSYADAPVLAHVVEYIFTAEALETDLYTPEGYCRQENSSETAKVELSRPRRLIWNISDVLSSKIQAALKFNKMEPSRPVDRCLLSYYTLFFYTSLTETFCAQEPLRSLDEDLMS